MTGEVSSLVLLSRHLTQRRTAELKALASSWLACRQFGWRLPLWASRHIWPQLPRWPHTTTRMVASVCPRFRSMPAGTAAAIVQQYLGSALPLANTSVHICQSHPVLLHTHSTYISTTLLPGPYFTATATPHPAAPSPSPRLHMHSHPQSSALLPLPHGHPPKSNPTIDIDSCAAFVGRLVGGARSRQ